MNNPADRKAPRVIIKITCSMDDVQLDVLRSPHCSKPAALIVNKNSSFESNEKIQTQESN